MHRRNFLVGAGLLGSLGTLGCVGNSLEDSGEPVPPDEWPMPRVGPGGTGHHPTASAPTEQLSVRWNYEFENGPGYGPRVAGGTVFVTDSVDSSHESPVGLVALDAADGTVRWTAEKHYQVSTRPAVGDGRVYVGDENATLAAHDVENGSLAWKFDVGSASTGRVVVADGVAYAVSSSTLFAVDAADGTELWRTEIDGVRASPTVRRETVYVTQPEALIAVDAGNGSGRWRRSFDSAVAHPVSTSRSALYVRTDGALLSLDPATGRRRWGVETESPYPPLAATDETVFVTDGRLRALDAADGSERWARAAPEGTYGFARPVVVDGSVIVPSEPRIYAFDAADGSERLLYDPRGHARHHAPAVVDGILYVRRRDSVVALGPTA